MNVDLLALGSNVFCHQLNLVSTFVCIYILGSLLSLPTHPCSALLCPPSFQLELRHEPSGMSAGVGGGGGLPRGHASHPNHSLPLFAEFDTAARSGGVV